jgi:hypothetical protein
MACRSDHPIRGAQRHARTLVGAEPAAGNRQRGIPNVHMDLRCTRCDLRTHGDLRDGQLGDRGDQTPTRVQPAPPSPGRTPGTEMGRPNQNAWSNQRTGPSLPGPIRPARRPNNGMALAVAPHSRSALPVAPYAIRSANPAGRLQPDGPGAAKRAGQGRRGKTSPPRFEGIDTARLHGAPVRVQATALAIPRYTRSTSADVVRQLLNAARSAGMPSSKVGVRNVSPPAVTASAI